MGRSKGLGDIVVVIKGAGCARERGRCLGDWVFVSVCGEEALVHLPVHEMLAGGLVWGCEGMFDVLEELSVDEVSWSGGWWVRVREVGVGWDLGGVGVWVVGLRSPL